MINRETISKLKAYSLLSGSFLVSHNSATPQVIYTDIEPDTVFDESYEGAYFDIDNNGEFDFTVVNYSWTFTTYSYDVINRQDILAGPFISANAIAGILISYYGAGIRYFPYAIEKGELIKEDLDWQTAGIQIMGLRDYVGDGTHQCLACYWYGENYSERIDHYLGLRFIGDDEKDHYGWMRCDVLDEGRVLVVKDYAYETKPDRYIIAGDTIGATDISESNDLIANIYSFGSTIYISTGKQPVNTYVRVIDLLGKEVYNSQINEIDPKINLDVSDGYYVVELKESEKRLTKKLFINH